MSSANGTTLSQTKTNGSIMNGQQANVNHDVPLPSHKKQKILSSSSSAAAAAAAVSPSSKSASIQQLQKLQKLQKPLHPLSGSSPTDLDSAFCTEVARRSVARAALHLGMEGMEGVALDALASVYLGYMDMVGSTISTMVESSGRSSAHVNAYDALNAIEDCTAPAAAQLASASGGVVVRAPLGKSSSSSSNGSNDGDEDDDTDASGSDNSNNKYVTEDCQATGWEALATFLFGSEWYSIPLQGEEEEKEALKKKNATGGIKSTASGSSNTGGAAKKPGGKTILPKMPASAAGSASGSMIKGKQLSNLVSAAGGGVVGSATEKNVTFSMDSRPDLNDLANDASNVGEGRWNAPYLGPLAPFPLVSSTKDIANPHRLDGTKAVLSLHNLAMEVEACRGSKPGIGDKAGLGPLTKRPKKGNVGGAPSSSTSTIGDKAKKASASTPDSAENDKSSSTVDGARHEVETMEAARLAEERAMRAELRIPEDVFSAGDRVWGCIREKGDVMEVDKDDKQDSGNAKTPDTTKAAITIKDSTKSTSSKVTFDSSTKPPPIVNSAIKSQSNEDQNSTQTLNNFRMPPYVPNFMPPFPSESSELGPDDISSSIAASQIMGKVIDAASYRREKRKLRMSESNPTPSTAQSKNGASGRDSLRRSVIGLGSGKSLGSSYWGSEWLKNDGVDGNKNGVDGVPIVAVTSGLTGNPDSAGKGAMESQSVAPLGRASGSRVSKILEGSMNI